MNDPYVTLGLPPGASEADIKAAYRKLAAEYHPDRTGGDDSKIKEINAARDALLKGEWAQAQSKAQAHRGPFPHDFDIGSFDDLLRAFNAGSRRRNPDIHVTVNMVLEDAFTGKNLTLLVPTPNGPREVSIRVPPGVDSGNRMRVNGAGDHTFPNLPAGDLHIDIAVAEHPTFARIGRNLVLKRSIDVFTALLGGKINVTGIDGTTNAVTVPPLMQPGTHLRLPGHGMPALQGGNRGDLLLLFEVSIPERLSDDQIALLERARSIA